MIYIRPFEVSDFEAFVPIEPLAKAEIGDPELAQAIEDSCLAVTGIRDGEVVGCGGVHPIEDIPEQGEMWLRLSKTCQQYPLDTLRWLGDGLKIIEETYPFEQLNATVKCCFEKSIRMIEHLGFTQTEIRDGEWAIYSKRIK